MADSEDFAKTRGRLLIRPHKLAANLIAEVENQGVAVKFWYFNTSKNQMEVTARDHAGNLIQITVRLEAGGER